VDSRAFPLFTYDPRRGPTIAERLVLAGNPAIDRDWHRLPDGSEYDFVEFARGEGRFAPHFAKDGTPTNEVLASRDDRLANWRTLQELAGIGRPPVTAESPRKPTEATPTMTAGEAQAAAATCLQCPDPTCVAACPIRVDIPRYLELVAVGEFAGAAEVLRSHNPMATVTSRVCEQERQCEGSCKGTLIEGTVPIRAIERFVADWAAAQPSEDVKVTPTDNRVAVVGAGPAGLACAGELARRGHAVTVIDAYDAAGGILRYGIPAYRLPRAVVDAEVDALRALGVTFQLGVRIGESETLEQLHARFDAVFLAVGVAASVMPEIPGQELSGVITAADYLERVNRPSETDPSLRAGAVIVLGAGNVAMDAARSAVRLGAEHVTVVYRRGRGEVPACEAEVHEAEAEGVEFAFLAAPRAILGDADGRVRGIRCTRMRLGDADETGRRRPMPTDEELELVADQVIIALGSRAEEWLAETGAGVATDADGRVVARDASGTTSISGIYAGGDVVRGSATVVHALGDGTRAAAAIDRHLQDRHAAVPSGT
jgi:glutamate synthase (NADPH/NADH) small chain